MELLAFNSPSKPQTPAQTRADLDVEAFEICRESATKVNFTPP